MFHSWLVLLEEIPSAHSMKGRRLLMQRPTERSEKEPPTPYWNVLIFLKNKIAHIKMIFKCLNFNLLIKFVLKDVV